MDKKYEDSIHRTGRIGIIIGITSVVTIVSIGNGLKADVMEAANEQSNTVVIQTNTEEVSDTEAIIG